MKILIVDDSAENLKIAKKAATKFPEHDFVFSEDAAEALAMIEKDGIDGVVTDLFFPRTQPVDPKKYEEYIDAFEKSVLLALESVESYVRELYIERIWKNKTILQKSSFAAYGGTIALDCISSHIPFVIISDLHNHQMEEGFYLDSEPSRMVDGISILSPLVGKRLVSGMHLLEDYHPLHYLGTYFPKNKVKSWQDAISMVLSQPTKESVREKIRSKEETEKERRAKLLEEKSEKECTRLDKLRGDIVISKQLEQQIMKYINEGSLVIVSPEVAAVVTNRSEYGSVGGIGYWSQLRVFCGNKSEMQEWQWRDRYDARRDRPWLSIQNLGEIIVKKVGEKIEISVEIINRSGNRAAHFIFDLPEQSDTAQAIPAERQKEFVFRVEKEKKRLIMELDEKWKRSSKMLGGTGYVSYRQPCIKQDEIRQDIGVAAFVIEEQIDHRGSDAQIRHNLYIMTMENQNASLATEDHGYGREGGSFLTIIDISRNSITINTKAGKLTIKI